MTWVLVNNKVLTSGWQSLLDGLKLIISHYQNSGCAVWGWFDDSLTFSCMFETQTSEEPADTTGTAPNFKFKYS